MKNYKNYLIAVLSGLLILSLSTQQAQSAAKTYDAVKLAEYQSCLNAQNNYDIALMQSQGGNGSMNILENLKNCLAYKPY